MNRFLQLCLLVLVTLTVGHAQIFGVQRGFVCADNVKPQASAAEHCHRNGGNRAFTPCENRLPSSDCPTGEVSRHNPLMGKLDSKPLPVLGTITAPQFVQALLADVAAFQWLLELGSHESNSELISFPADIANLYRTTSVLVAQCMVLLV